MGMGQGGAGEGQQARAPLPVVCAVPPPHLLCLSLFVQKVPEPDGAGRADRQPQQVATGQLLQLGREAWRPSARLPGERHHAAAPSSASCALPLTMPPGSLRSSWLLGDAGVTEGGR